MARNAQSGNVPRKGSRAVFLRRLSQGLFLAAFIILLFLTENTGEDRLALPVRIFLDFDPLHGLSSFLANLSFPEKFYLAAVTLALTVLLGRVFCGWVCPFGTLNQCVSFRKKDKVKVTVKGKGADKVVLPVRGGFDYRRLKVLMLAGLLVAALLGLNLTGLLDPISLAIRSFALAVLPAMNQALRPLFDALSRTPLASAADGAYLFLRDHHVIAFNPPRFHQALVVALVFAGILLLNMRRKRFFCRYLCPLGALLGLFSRRAFTRLEVDASSCTSCTRCNQVCPSGAEPWPPGAWKKTECFACYNCVKVCPETCIGIGLDRLAPSAHDEPRVQLGRRRLVIAAATGALAVPLTRSLALGATASPEVIRPPGSREEGEFLRTCVRCGECMKVCITNGLQPALLEAGFEGLWTPVFDMKRGYCEYACTLCGQVCPTQAIRELNVKLKQKVKIGLAFIDTTRCLPHAFGIDCIVCEEHCPTPTKAIWFESRQVTDREGRRRAVKMPHVDPELCIGCGICENKCPVIDLPAIRVTSIQESRSMRNRMLL